MKAYNVAVLGATGLVGGTILKILEERDFPINHLYLFSSKKSAGLVTFKARGQVQELGGVPSLKIRICFLQQVVTMVMPSLVDKGVKVIDYPSV